MPSTSNNNLSKSISLLSVNLFSANLLPFGISLEATSLFLATLTFLLPPLLSVGSSCSSSGSSSGSTGSFGSSELLGAFLLSSKPKSNSSPISNSFSS